METLWPLPMLLFMSMVAADGRRWEKGLTEAVELTEVSVVTVVETLWPMPMLLSVIVVADRTEVADGNGGGD